MCKLSLAFLLLRERAYLPMLKPLLDRKITQAINTSLQPVQSNPLYICKFQAEIFFPKSVKKYFTCGTKFPIMRHMETGHPSKRSLKIRNKMKTVKQFIDENHEGCIRRFAKIQGVDRKTVYNWINRGDIVIDGVRYQKQNNLKSI